MSTMVKNRDVRTLALGVRVSKAPAQLPQGTTGNIFTVTGGRIKVIQVLGEVTTVFAADATTIKIGYTPTVGSYADWSIASAAMASAPLSTHFWVPAAAGSALSTDKAALGGGIIKLVSYIVPAGAITLTTVGSQSTGRQKWDLYYVPVDTTAVVVAA